MKELFDIQKQNKKMEKRLPTNPNSLLAKLIEQVASIEMLKLKQEDAEQACDQFYDPADSDGEDLSLSKIDFT